MNVESEAERRYPDRDMFGTRDFRHDAFIEGALWALAQEVDE